MKALDDETAMEKTMALIAIAYLDEGMMNCLFFCSVDDKTIAVSIDIDNFF